MNKHYKSYKLKLRQYHSNRKMSWWHHHILPALPESYPFFAGRVYKNQKKELCIWRFVSSGCHSCNGHSVKCEAYLSQEEIERREIYRREINNLEKNLEEI